eukprot:TRINITY_DN8781_c0_g1_i2.p1 TRINITY_DN8781_c0_g1~~TRINITY_DN8781_c0_g1_i2.p1  ORF type:complete len:1145 (+),score=275.73 TRINITY_DN8781_c0_g1_i2:249-3683(+)
MAMELAKHHQHHQNVQHHLTQKKGNCTLKREELLGHDLQKGQTEILDWVSSALGESLPTIEDDGADNNNRLYFVLRDGTVLCKLFAKLFPGRSNAATSTIHTNFATSSGAALALLANPNSAAQSNSNSHASMSSFKFNTNPRLPFKKLENITIFLDALRKEKIIKDQDLFETSDLYEQKNMSKVMSCLILLKKWCESGSTIDNTSLKSQSAAQLSAPARNNSLFNVIDNWKQSSSSPALPLNVSSIESLENVVVEESDKTIPASNETTPREVAPVVAEVQEEKPSVLLSSSPTAPAAQPSKGTPPLMKLEIKAIPVRTVPSPAVNPLSSPRSPRSPRSPLSPRSPRVAPVNAPVAPSTPPVEQRSPRSPRFVQPVDTPIKSKPNDDLHLSSLVRSPLAPPAPILAVKKQDSGDEWPDELDFDDPVDNVNTTNSNSMKKEEVAVEPVNSKFAKLIEKDDDDDFDDWDDGEDVPRIKLSLPGLGTSNPSLPAIPATNPTPTTPRRTTNSDASSIPVSTTVSISPKVSPVLVSNDKEEADEEEETPIVLRDIKNSVAEDDDPFSSDDENDTDILALRKLIKGDLELIEESKAELKTDQPKEMQKEQASTTVDLKILQARWAEESEQPKKKEKIVVPEEMSVQLSKWKDKDVEDVFDEYFDDVTEIKFNAKPKEPEVVVKPNPTPETKEEESHISFSRIQHRTGYQPTDHAVTNIAYSFYCRAVMEPTLVAYNVLKSKQSRRKTISFLSTTWNGWNAQVSRMARNLLLLGINSGDQVCLASRIGPLWHSLLLAALSIGAVVVISPSKVNQASVIQHCRPKLVLLDTVRQIHEYHVNTIDSVTHVLVAQSASSSVTPRQAMGGKRAYTFVQFMQLNRQLPTEEEALRIESHMKNIKPEQPALVYYPKSKPQPVILSHKNLLWTANELNASLKDKLQAPIKTTCSHVLHGLFQFVVDLLLPTVCGGTINFYGRCPPTQSIKVIVPSLLYFDAEILREYNILLRRELPSKDQFSVSPYVAEVLKRALGIHQAHVIGAIDEIELTESVEVVLKLLHIPFYPVVGIPETTSITHIAFNGELNKVNVRNFFSLAIQSKMRSDGSIVISGPNIAIGHYSEDGQMQPTTAEDGWLVLPSSVLSHLSRGGRTSRYAK